MSWVRSPAGKAILAVLAIYVVMIAVVLGARAAGVQLGSDIRAGLAVAFAVPVGWFVLSYWRAIDEAAREAQKWAWFWGGAAGMVATMVAIFWQPRWVLDTFADGASPTHAMHVGVMVLLAAQLIGFLVAWTLWWWRRR